MYSSNLNGQVEKNILEHIFSIHSYLHTCVRCVGISSFNVGATYDIILFVTAVRLLIRFAIINTINHSLLNLSLKFQIHPDCSII